MKKMKFLPKSSFLTVYLKQIYYFYYKMNNTKTQPANIKVFCRFRPFNYQELDNGNTEPVHRIISDQHLLIKQPYKGDDLTFVYDKIFKQEATQQEIYNQVGAPILQNILDGFNGTIMAYGQTSSGKTYTVQGISSDPKKKGIIPRMIQNLFMAIQKSPACIEYKLKVSILQLYMQKLYDLIDCNKADLKIRQSKIDGPYVQGKTEVYISDKNQLLRLMNLAHKNRVTCMTSMNASSSRSHLVFQLNLSQFNSETEQAKVSNLFIVDLAGSQKVSRTGAQGKVLQQAKKINLSLTSLAKVIKSLSQKITHIPYRESKLTRIIQDSLGGNSKTTLILNCSPSECNVSETISTLRFGQTAQKIKNKPKINRQPTIKQLQNIIIRLQSRIKFKDQWILMLEAHLKNKLGISIPKKQCMTRTNTERKQYTNFNEEQNLATLMASLNDESLNPESILGDFKLNFDKYLGQTIKLPNFESQVSNLNFKYEIESDSSQEDKNSVLQSQLTVCHNNLSQQITKISQLKMAIENKQKQTLLMDEKEVIQNQNRIENEELMRLRLQNRALMKQCENLKGQKGQLQQILIELRSKIGQKQKKIRQLKQMLRQIQQEMQLMDQEYEQQQPISLNTKIANPIKRSTIICE